MKDMYCYVDGGYNKDHITKGYGSYAIIYNNKEIEHSNIFELPVKSHNEAEYYSLIILLDTITKRGDYENFRWHIYSDSIIVVNQSTGRFRTLAPNLIPLNKLVKMMLDKIPYVVVKWKRRNKIKAVLGH